MKIFPIWVLVPAGHPVGVPSAGQQPDRLAANGYLAFLCQIFGARRAAAGCFFCLPSPALGGGKRQYGWDRWFEWGCIWPGAFRRRLLRPVPTFWNRCRRLFLGGTARVRPPFGRWINSLGGTLFFTALGPRGRATCIGLNRAAKAERAANRVGHVENGANRGCPALAALGRMCGLLFQKSEFPKSPAPPQSLGRQDPSPRESQKSCSPSWVAGWFFVYSPFMCSVFLCKCGTQLSRSREHPRSRRFDHESRPLGFFRPEALRLFLAGPASFLRGLFFSCSAGFGASKPMLQKCVLAPAAAFFVVDGCPQSLASPNLVGPALPMLGRPGFFFVKDPQQCFFGWGCGFPFFLAAGEAGFLIPAWVAVSWKKTYWFFFIPGFFRPGAVFQFGPLFCFWAGVGAPAWSKCESGGADFFRWAFAGRSSGVNRENCQWGLAMAGPLILEGIPFACLFAARGRTPGGCCGPDGPIGKAEKWLNEDEKAQFKNPRRPAWRGP